LNPEKKKIISEGKRERHGRQGVESRNGVNLGWGKEQSKTWRGRERRGENCVLKGVWEKKSRVTSEVDLVV